MTMLRNALPPQMTVDDWITSVRAVTMCGLAVLFGVTLCIGLFFRNYVDPGVLAAVLTSNGIILGYLAGKRSPVPDQPKQTETTKI